MHILVTVSDMKRLGIILDLESGETRSIPVRSEFVDPTVIERPTCRPFGITWNGREVFIANNRKLLVFDNEFNYLRTSPTKLQINIHQLAYHAECVWAVSPWTNSLIGVPLKPGAEAVELDLGSHIVRPYDQRDQSPEDEWHFNSLLWTDGCLFVAAHAFENMSFINRYDAPTLRLDGVHRDAGYSIHGLARYRGELFWISTMTREIRSDAGYCLPLSRPGYARGLAMTSQYFIVAISSLLARRERHIGDSWIQVIDREQGSVLNEINLSDTGSINDLRLLDEYDYAHGVNPLWQSAGQKTACRDGQHT
jgi:hypothetical protein